MQTACIIESFTFVVKDYIIHFVLIMISRTGKTVFVCIKS